MNAGVRRVSIDLGTWRVLFTERSSGRAIQWKVSFSGHGVVSPQACHFPNFSDQRSPMETYSCPLCLSCNKAPSEFLCIFYDLKCASYLSDTLESVTFHCCFVVKQLSCTM